MKRLYFIILVVAMVLTSIGLVVVQVVQTHRSVKVSRNLFNVSVSNAMDNVVAQFDQMKLDDYVSSADQVAIRAYRRYEELNDRMIDLVSRHEDLFYNEHEVRFGTVLQDSAFIRRYVRLSRSDSTVLKQYNTLLNARRRLQMTNAKSLARMDQGLRSNDEVFSSDFNYALLDSIVREELLITGVEVSPELGVLRASSEELLYCSSSSMKDELLHSAYRYNLHLGGLPSIDDYYLVLAFHSSDLWLLTNYRTHQIIPFPRIFWLLQVMPDLFLLLR